jgi:hypothetical protein
MITMTTTTVSGLTDEKRKQKINFARQAMNLAKTDIDTAVDFMKQRLPWAFLTQFQGFENSIKIIDFIFNHSHSILTFS